MNAAYGCCLLPGLTDPLSCAPKAEDGLFFLPLEANISAALILFISRVCRALGTFAVTYDRFVDRLGGPERVVRVGGKGLPSESVRS